MTNPNTVRPEKFLTAWGDFLKARKAMIAELWNEGESVEYITHLLSLECTQTHLIIMSIERLKSGSLKQNSKSDSND